MNNLLKEFKSAMEEAEKNDITVRVSMYGNRTGLTCMFTFPQVEITDNYICVTNYDNMNQFIVDREYEIKKEEDDCGDFIYKIICEGKIYDVEIYS